VNKVSITIEGYGHVEVTSTALEVTIEKYLPATKRSLQEIYLERSELEWETIRDWGIMEFMMVFADWDCNIDDCIYSVDQTKEEVSA